jgi:hypothetical protein
MLMVTFSPMSTRPSARYAWDKDNLLSGEQPAIRDLSPHT